MVMSFWFLTLNTYYKQKSGNNNDYSHTYLIGIPLFKEYNICFGYSELSLI